MIKDTIGAENIIKYVKEKNFLIRFLNIWIDDMVLRKYFSDIDTILYEKPHDYQIVPSDLLLNFMLSQNMEDEWDYIFEKGTNLPTYYYLNAHYNYPMYKNKISLQIAEVLNLNEILGLNCLPLNQLIPDLRELFTQISCLVNFSEDEQFLEFIKTARKLYSKAEIEQFVYTLIRMLNSPVK